MFGTSIDDLLTEKELREYTIYRDSCRVQVSDFADEESELGTETFASDRELYNINIAGAE